MTVPPALRSASPSSLRKQGSHRTRQRQGKGRAPARKIAPEDISGFRGGRVSKKRLEGGFGVFLSRGQRPGAALIATPSAKSRLFSGRQGANSGRSCLEHTVNADPATPPDAKTALQQADSWGLPLNAATAARAGTAATAAPRGVKRVRRFHRKAHVGKIDCNAAGRGCKFLFHAERQPVHIKTRVGIGRLIQSQRKARAASAAGSEINADGGFCLARAGEIGFKLPPGVIGQRNHVFLQRAVSLQHCPGIGADPPGSALLCRDEVPLPRAAFP